MVQPVSLGGEGPACIPVLECKRQANAAQCQARNCEPHRRRGACEGRCGGCAQYGGLTVNGLVKAHDGALHVGALHVHPPSTTSKRIEHDSAGRIVRVVDEAA